MSHTEGERREGFYYVGRYWEFLDDGERREKKRELLNFRGGKKRGSKGACN